MLDFYSKFIIDEQTSLSYNKQTTKALCYMASAA